MSNLLQEIESGIGQVFSKAPAAISTVEAVVGEGATLAAAVQAVQGAPSPLAKAHIAIGAAAQGVQALANHGVSAPAISELQSVFAEMEQILATFSAFSTAFSSAWQQNVKTSLPF